jgi:mono/diheme cytochrome c family protein
MSIATTRPARSAPTYVWLMPAMLAMNCAHGYEPQANYMLNCMGCHIADGSGAPGKVPSFRNTLVPFAQTPAGRRYLVQVPGASQSILTDRELAELLNWMMRSLSDVTVTSGVQDFTAAEVTSYRSERLKDPAATRARLLTAASSAHP